MYFYTHTPKKTYLTSDLKKEILSLLTCVWKPQKRTERVKKGRGKMCFNSSQ